MSEHDTGCRCHPCVTAAAMKMSEPTESSLAAPALLDTVSRKFHAFEWLRQEAIKGNAHAEQLMQEVVWLRGIRGQAKRALKECNADADNSEAALLRQMCNASI